MIDDVTPALAAPSEMPSTTHEDHRPRVAAERRQRMRSRLVESAMVVFAQKGIGASVIQDVVAAAEVSQGSFYNYFRTNEELLTAVGEDLSDEMVRLIETVVGDIDDPALRVATAVRSYLHIVRTYRVVASFLSSAGLRLTGKESAVAAHLPSDLAEGLKRGRFEVPSLDVAVDVIGGAGMMAIHRMASGRTPKDYPEQVTLALLRALGLNAKTAAALVATPIPKLAAPADSLLARAQVRHAASATKPVASS